MQKNNDEQLKKMDRDVEMDSLRNQCEALHDKLTILTQLKTNI